MPPYSIRLRLHRYYRAKHSNCTIKHPKGTLYLNGKVHVTRGIDYINSVIFPDTVSGSRLNGNSPLRSEEHTSELQSRGHLVCRLLLEKKNKLKNIKTRT